MNQCHDNLNQMFQPAVKYNESENQLNKHEEEGSLKARRLWSEKRTRACGIWKKHTLKR